MVEVEVGDGQHLAAAVAHDDDRGGDERVPPAPVVVVGGGQHLVAAVARDDGRGGEESAQPTPIAVAAGGSVYLEDLAARVAVAARPARAEARVRHAARDPVRVQPGLAPIDG